MTDLEKLLNASVHFGTFVRMTREAKGMSQEQLCAACDVKLQYIKALEANVANPPSDALVMQIACALEACPDVVFAAANRLPPDMRSSMAKVVLFFREFERLHPERAKPPPTAVDLPALL